MVNMVRNFFIHLSNNVFLNKQAKKWGFFLGADKFIAGTTIQNVSKAVKQLNTTGISCTLDNLGEFVLDKTEANKAKEKILSLLEAIEQENMDCHLSVKLTQLGLDIDQDYCISNMIEILDLAKKYNIFVNIDMEDYAHYDQTLTILKYLRKNYTNVGTVIQAYLYRSEDDLIDLKDVRIRLVKGAYKEDAKVAFQNQQEIDDNFLRLCKKRLLDGAFTSFATHDHHIIDELKNFVKENNLDQDRFEFQMLYGFRNDLQSKLAKEGYHFCTYIPFGDDWFGYFMRRLAERPQNLNLVIKDAFYTDNNRLKKRPVITSLFIVCFATICCIKARRRKS
ncbi:proline dehydrogenase family protein [Virgibacillus sp. Bac330]|uniref:proline dehydrogenase family protein n=1 Tax=Virgibacillus sp. Bac330 TaxID=2419841 RepID=UPI000EF4A68C|nr:proline dehydrogenase family protein [Virgibacillus sp. Bac330]